MLNTIAERGAGFRSLGDAWADTTSSHGRLLLAILAGLAEYERDLIRARAAEGRDRARARGIRFGRPEKLTEFQREEALERLQQGEAVTDVARAYNVSRWTISRLNRRLVDRELNAIADARSSEPITKVTLDDL